MSGKYYLLTVAKIESDGFAYAYVTAQDVGFAAAKLFSRSGGSAYVVNAIEIDEKTYAAFNSAARPGAREDLLGGEQ